MRNILPIILLLLTGATSWAQRPQTEHYLDPYNPEFVQGEILIKFKDEVVLNIPKSGTVTKTGVSAVDELLKSKSVASVEQVFKNATRLKSRPVVKYPNGEEKQIPALYNIYRIKLDTKADIKSLVEEISDDPDVEYAEPNYLVYSMGDVSAVRESTERRDKACLVSTGPSSNNDDNKSTTNFQPNDPLYLSGDMWHINAVGAPAAWDTVTGSGQVIAIIDTGVDWDHPDLDDNIWTNSDEIPNNGIDDDNNGYIDDIRGWDYINNDNDPNDDNSHGTHVAGIAAAEGNNGIGMIGIAFEAKIMCLKVLQSSGTGNSVDLADAIDYAAQNGATVINMSLGSYGESLAVKDALEVAYSTSFPVAAAGNDALSIEAYPLIPKFPMFPACYSFVIGTEAQNASFSNFDPSGPIESAYGIEGYNYEVKAPGVGILSSFPNGGYHNLNGTSMASPIVAGAVAMMQEYSPTQSKEQIFAKLIQSSNGGPISIPSALNYTLLPDMYFIEYTLLDTCQGCDNDGAPDAGETIDIYLTVKNAGGYADSVWSKIRFAPFEDTTVATIIDSISYIGDMSAYAILTGELDHFQITIDSNTVNNRDIVFEYEIGCADLIGTISNEIIVNNQNGFELSGIMDSTLILTSDKLWLVNQSFLIGSNGVLVLSEGTHLIINERMTVDGIIESEGTENMPVIIESDNEQILGLFYKGTFNFNWTIVKNCDGISMFYYIHESIFNNCLFENIYFESLFHLENNINDTLFLYDCVFRNIITNHLFNKNTHKASCLVDRCNFSNIQSYSSLLTGTDDIIIFSNYSNVDITLQQGGILMNSWIKKLSMNNLFSNDICYTTFNNSYGYFDSIPNNYWGTNIYNNIENKIYDFSESSNYSQAIYQPILTQPSDSAHGCVWKVEIDGIDPQDEVLDPLGVGTYQFDVYFNKCMDIAYTPTLSFGVRDPHTQHIVSDNSYWSADSSIWTAFYDIGIETGDGINFIRVSDAVDTAGFDIPVEDNERFTFVIQAAASASIEFFATPGIGKVELEWPPADTEDGLGFNLYRYQFIDSVNTTDSIRINDELIIDTVFTDFDVVPYETYYYFYKILGTDMAESDRSKIMSATPFNAANGDANGDLAVNVLDITTIVAYLLNQNPTPFLFDAADVNYDGQINVLDIIGAVQLISGGAPPNKVMIANSEADIYLLDDRIAINSIGQVSALQFELSGEQLDKVKLFAGQPGFEFAYVQSGNKIIGVLYSFDNKTLPAGYHDILRIEKPSYANASAGGPETNLSWASALGGDDHGFYVDIHKHQGEPTTPLNFDLLAAYPNPFSHETTIRYQLPEPAKVQMDIFDMNGRLVKTLLSANKPEGYHQVIWNGRDAEGKQVSDGIFICTLHAVDQSGKESKKEMKIVLMK